MFNHRWVHPSEKQLKVIEYDNDEYVSKRELTKWFTDREEELSDTLDQTRGHDGSVEEEAESKQEWEKFLELKKEFIKLGIIYKPNTIRLD